MTLARRTMFAALAAGAALCPGSAARLGAAELSVEVGGVPMVASKTIVENIVGSKDHATLVSAIESTGLAATLQGDGPFTLFAPVDKAFAGLPKGTLDTLRAPENREQLTRLVTYHVVAGRYSAADLVTRALEGGGKVILETLQGESLVVSHDGRKLVVFDAAGGKAVVTIPDAGQSNGVVHVVDRVLQPQT